MGDVVCRAKITSGHMRVDAWRDVVSGAHDSLGVRAVEMEGACSPALSKDTRSRTDVVDPPSRG